MSSALYRLVFADILNPVSDSRCQLLRNAALVLKKTKQGYIISELGRRADIERIYKRKRSIEKFDFSNNVILPGFFDMHFHWVQDKVCQMPKESLLSWLQDYTWPYEHTFKNRRVSLARAKKMQRALLEAGTLGGMTYASTHSHTVDHALTNFTGYFLAGNVAMTMHSPSYLLQTEEEAIMCAEEGFKTFGSRYVATPRFAPTAHPEVMAALASLRRHYNGFVQTHLSETRQEVKWVLSIFKKWKGFHDVKSYLEIYDRVGLVTERAIFGHSIYLSDEEWRLMRLRKAAVAHCPTSNAPLSQQGLGSGLFDFERADKEKVRWMLATDIGAGPFLSMIDVMRSFVKQNEKRKKKGATFTRALARCTIHSARFLGIEKKAGNLSVDREANFLVLPAVAEKKNETAESVLRSLFDEQLKSREDCLQQVQQSWYRGSCYFSR